jgi:hypothetical protein
VDGKEKNENENAKQKVTLLLLRFAFLRAQVRAVAVTTFRRGEWIEHAAVPADLLVEKVVSCNLSDSCIGNGHFLSLVSLIDDLDETFVIVQLVGWAAS